MISFHIFPRLIKGYTDRRGAADDYAAIQSGHTDRTLQVQAVCGGIGKLR